MIGLDTNVWVRYLTQDDPQQTEQATQLISSITPDNPAFISSTTLAELSWVLLRGYGFNKVDFCDCLESLMHTQGIVIQDIDTARAALRLFKKSTADLADCMIYCASHAAGCTATMTFDAAAKSCGMTLVKNT